MEIIQSTKDFKRYIVKYQNQRDHIFRGQANADWNIVSSAYRFINEAYPSLRITNEILTAYEQRIPEYVGNSYPKAVHREENNYSSKLLCILQHMGGKTTYVDFSNNFKVASYFACEQYEDKDGMIFVCKKDNDDDKVYNLNGVWLGDGIKISKDEIEKLSYPAATNRMSVQQSCFLKIQKNKGSLSREDICDNGCILIKKEIKREILDYLSQEENICRQKIYPDIYDFISHQSLYNEYAHDFSKSILRGVSQTIKDGCVKKVNNALMTIDYLIKNQKLSTPDELRCDYLRVLGLLCEQKFTNALNILSQIKDEYIKRNRYYIFEPYNNTDDYDPIPQLFIISFEQAKCYMGLKDYDKAEMYFEETEKIVCELVKNNIIDSEGGCSPKVCIEDFWKCYAKALVRKEKSNLIFAKELLGKVPNTRTDEAELYVIAEQWESAIVLLKSINNENKNDDYACNLLGNCYMALAKSGSNRYIEKAIECYNAALTVIERRKPESRYTPKTEPHDHYYKLAIAYKVKGKFGESAKNYIKIIEHPYENEDAMHDLAYMYYKCFIHHKLNVGVDEICKAFASAITRSRMEKRARNFNDLGCFLFDISKQEVFNALSKDKDALFKYKDALAPIWRQQDEYPQKVKILLNKLHEITESETDLRDILLKISEKMFEIANYLHDKDAFANKKLGDIYFTQYNVADNYEDKQNLGKKALTVYYLAKSFYLLENKRCAEIEQNIELLNNILKYNIKDVDDEI